ncbi:MAG: S-layer homology domain-containing protein, partial [Patescibacteria group bacterium]
PFYEDHMVDEDPPGDANGDGCPGRCNYDDNGNGVDHDDDGYPTGWELANDYEWNDQRKPHRDVENKTGFTTAQLKANYVDEDYRDIVTTASPSCYGEDGIYHNEWDDDEDGYCDEDGSTEPSNDDPSCAFNDNDCDGVIDEDPMGYKPEGLFEELPDIQAKGVVEELVSRYVDLFEQPQGVWNRMVGSTGRYATQAIQDETVISDYDSAASLIAKKDEFTLQYLRSVNDYFEARVNTMVEPLTEEIPLVIAMEITGTVTYEPELDNDGNEKEPKVDDMCKDDSNDAEKACLQFVNHSTSETGTEKASNLSPSNSFLYGSMMNSIDEAARCSSFGGTFEDGQFVKYSALYSKTAQEIQAEYYKSKSDEQKYKGCLLKNKIFETEDPDEEICFSVLAEYPVRSEDGAILFEDTERYDINGFEVGPHACYEYRHLDTYQIYSKVNGSFSDWLTKSLRKDDEEFEEYEDVVAAIEGEKDNIADSNDGNRPGEVTLRAGFDTLSVFRDDGKDINYTLQQFFNDLGLGSYSYDDLDVYMTMHSSATVNNPSGANMGDIDTIQVFFDKFYIKDDDPGNRTEDLSEARKIPSLYYHTEPDYDTLNTQIEDAAVNDLPIDATRRVSFFDVSDDYREVEYLNVFDADDTADVTTQIKNLLTDMNAVPGSEIYTDEITDFLSEINEDQLEDALDWYHKNIDEKHDYVFTHYLGLEEPVVAKAREGYEIFSLIAHGNADELHYGFNASAPEIEEDLIFNYRTDDAAEAAESNEIEPIGEVNLLPVSLLEWMDEMEEWLGDVQDSVSSFDLTPDDLACSADSFLHEADVSDEDENGIPDLSDSTVTLELTSEDNSVLQAGGKDIYIVTVSARKSNGVVNTDDDFTEVEIEFISGDESLEISGPPRLQLTDGVATFILESAEVGDFQIEATAFNRSDLNDSNSLSGLVSDKFVKVSSYITDEGADSDALMVQGSSVEIFDGNGNLAAVFNPVTGDLDVRIGEAVLYEATATVATRAAVVPVNGGEAYGSIYIIPNEKTVSIGDGVEGVFVEELGAVATAEKVDDYVELYVNGVNMGIVTSVGQINVGDGYRLEFENPGEINLYDPIQILDLSGEVMFSVNVKQSFDTADLLDPVGTYAPYLQLSFKWLKEKLRFASLFPRAEAASSIPDSDHDLLDDLEEVTIGTDLDEADTDGDGYNDGTEIFSGYSALAGNGVPLFTDMNAGHPAFHDVAVLYLRGVLRGYADGSFRPDNNMIREEFVQVDLGAICIACQHFSDAYKAEVLDLY